MQAAIETPDVAKKKASKPEKAKPDTSWLERAKKPVVVQVRGSDDFKAWVDGLSEFDRRAISDLVELALVQYAQRINYPKEPPKR